MEDRAKKRRIYLLKKASAGTMLCVGMVISLCFGLLTLACCIATVAMFVITPGGAMVGLLVTAVPGLIAYLGIRIVLAAHNGSVELPYVPPVTEQIAALPDGEILLRGSEEATSVQSQLLRAAAAGTDKDGSELLRPIDHEGAAEKHVTTTAGDGAAEDP